MPVIDPDGLFSGDRFGPISDMAHLYWPFFWCASNSLGRIELNYSKFAPRAFVRFKNKIDEETFWSLVREYQDAYLLFVYAAPDGSVWGEWDVLEKCKPKYKLKPDTKMPAPKPEEFEAWKQEYRLKKASKVRAMVRFNGTGIFPPQSPEPNEDNELPEDEAPHEEIPQNSPYIGIGGEMCMSEGDFLKPSSTDVEAQSHEDQPELNSPLEAHGKPEPAPPEAEHSCGPETFGLTEPQTRARKAAALERLQEKWFREEFWPLRWRPDGKQDALRAFKKHAKTEAEKDFLVKAMKAHRPQIDAMKERGLDPPYVATWLNKRRYEDELPPLAAMPARASPGDANGRSGADRRRAEILDMVGNG